MSPMFQTRAVISNNQLGNNNQLGKLTVTCRNSDQMYPACNVKIKIGNNTDAYIYDDDKEMWEKTIFVSNWERNCSRPYHIMCAGEFKCHLYYRNNETYDTDKDPFSPDNYSEAMLTIKGEKEEI